MMSQALGRKGCYHTNEIRYSQKREMRKDHVKVGLHFSGVCFLILVNHLRHLGACGSGSLGRKSINNPFPLTSSQEGSGTQAAHAE